MEESDLAKKLLSDLFTAAGALTTLQLRHLSPDARSRVNDAVRNETAHIELRVRLDTNTTEPVLVPTDGSGPLWLARTGN